MLHDFKIYALLVTIMLAIFSSKIRSENLPCGTDTSNIPHTAQLINQVIPVVVFFLDFPDGRIQPGNIIPIQDSDTSLIANIDAVGGMGWVNVGGQYRKKIRKYTYDDYWNWIFSEDYYNDDINPGVHPDFQSHGTKVYGSVKDYYLEATYNNIMIEPVQSWPGDQDMYHLGIGNKYDVANSKKYIHWIMMPNNRNSYDRFQLDVIARQVIIDMHNLQENDPNYINFNLSNYTGRIIYVFSGGKIAGYSKGDYKIAVAEKSENNSLLESILYGIAEIAHELGHALGLRHSAWGSYDLMHWGGFGNLKHYYCPPHFNPIAKLTKGWIPKSNVQIIGSNGSMSLPPINVSPVVGAIKVYGMLGSNDWNLDEYFIIEYRKRAGFNRFAGGEQTPGFTGGALIWHYAPYNPVSLNSPNHDEDTPIHLKVENYDPSFKGNSGNPYHFFPTRTILDTCTTCLLNSNSNMDKKTGIICNNFVIAGNNLSCNVSYTLGAPDYNIFIYNDSDIPSVLSGKVYFGRGAGIYDFSTDVRVEPGTIIDFMYHAGFVIDSRKFIAIGGTGPNDSIIFQGAGYQNYRIQWGISNYANVNAQVGIYYRPTSPPDTVIFQNCIIKNTPIGINVTQWMYENNWKPIIVQGNRFSCSEVDIYLQGKHFNTNPKPDISGFDNNIFTKMTIQGNWILNNASQFVIPASSSLTYEESPTNPPAHLDISNNRILNLYGPLFTKGSVQLKGGEIKLFQNATIQSNSTLAILPGTIIKLYTAKKIINYGKLTAEGTSSQHITFTSTAANPNPGDWYGIEIKCGPNSFKYCDVKYATQGITINTGIGTTIENCLVDHCSLYGIYGLNSMAYGAIYIKGTTLKNCGYYGLLLNNAWAYLEATPQSRTYLESNTLHGMYSINGYAYIDHTTFQNNGSVGLYVTSGSHIYLATNGTGAGWNVVKNNSDHQIHIYYCAYAFLGYAATFCNCGETFSSSVARGIASTCSPPCYWDYDEEGGYNSISGNDKWIYNLGSPCYAHLTYWDVNPTCPVNPPASGHFVGTVYTASPQCYPPPMAGMLEGKIEENMGVNKISDRISDYIYNDSLKKINLIEYLIRVIYEQPDSAEYVLPLLLPLVGPNGKYASTLDMPWENFLLELEQYMPNDNIRKQARIYRFLNRMFAQDYSGVISLANKLLSSKLSDDFWFYCQSQRISALVLMDRIEEAKNVLASIETRAQNISSDGLGELRRMIDISSSNVSSTGGEIGNDQPSVSVTSISKDFGLEQNYPNPFNPATTIKYTIREDCKVTLKIYNTLGQVVKSIVDDFQDAGQKSVSFDLSDLPSGMYFYRLQAGKLIAVKKMILVK